MDSSPQDFKNQAFVPYAINGDETTYVPNAKYDTLADHCKDDGYVKPFGKADTKCYHQYENPADVAKRAGLNRAGSGPRRKKNEIYDEAKKQQKVRLPDRPTTPTDGAENSPLVHQYSRTDNEKDRTRKCDLKTIIFFVLVLCLSAGGLALSLMNMLNKENCRCPKRGLKVQALVEPDNNVETYDDSSLREELQQLKKRFDVLNKQMVQQRQLLEKVNKTKPKLLKGDKGVQGPEGPVGAKGERGERGMQGSRGKQGPRGLPGMGNASRCVYKKEIETANTMRNMPANSRVKVDYIAPQNFKVLSAVCSTTHHKGAAVANLLSNSSDGRYTCECVGESQYGTYKPSSSKIQCVMHIWECPL